MTGHARTPARLVALVAAVVVIAGLLPAVAVAVAPSTAPTLTAPADGAHVGANPTLAWTSVAGAAKYRVQISPGPAFSTLIYNVDTYNTKATPPVDLPTGLLYWRAAGLDASNNAGPFGSATFIKDIIAGPTLQSPNDLATFAFPGQAETFSWSPVSGAKSYTLFIDDANDFIGARTYTTSGTSYTLTEPDTIDQTFYWRVQSMSTANILSAFSETRRYMVGWSATPTLVSPVNTTLTPITDVNFVWNPVVGAATYQLQVSPNGDWANNRVIDVIVKGTRYSPPATLDNGSYFWRVRARDAKGTPNNGAWSLEWQFTRGWPDRPSEATPAWTPPGGATPVVAVPTFSWTPVAHAAYYELQFSTDINFSPATISRCYTNHTEWTPYGSLTSAGEPGGCDWTISFAVGAQYYWRVRGIDAPKLGGSGVLGLWSSTDSSNTFRFIYSPSLVTDLGPTDGATVSTPVLSWSPISGQERYQVSIYKSNKSTLVQQVTTYATSWTPTVTLNPADEPFYWYVTTLDGAGHPGLIPASGTWRSFNITAPTTDTTLAFLTPIDGASVTRMPSMTWQPYTGATYYRVRYGIAGSGIINGTPLSGGTQLPYAGFTYAGVPLPQGTYLWYVEAWDGSGELADNYNPLDERTFTVGPPATLGDSDYLSPARCKPSQVCAKEGDTRTLSWNAVPDAGAYLVYVAQDQNFTNIYREYKTIYPMLTPRESYLDNQAGQAYFWFIRPCVDYAVTQCGPGPDTSANIHAGAYQKASAPVNLSSPAGGANVPNLVTFAWSDYLATNQALLPQESQEARQYHLQVSTVLDFASILDDVTVDQITYTPFSKTYPEGPLYWRVQAIDGSGNQLTLSPVRQVNKTSPAVVLSAPANGATVAGLPTLSWTPTNYVASYNLEIYKNGDLSFSPTNRVANVATKLAAWSPTTAFGSGPFAWRVQRVDVDGRVGPWSAGRTFTLQPAAPSLLTPADLATISSDNLLFTWTGVAGAAQYRLQTSTSTSFSSPVESQVTAMTAWAPTRHYADGTYYWRVQALDAAGNVVSTSSVRRFTRATPSAPVAQRWAGADRYATAATISAHTFLPNVPYAFVATGLNFPDALAGGAAGGYRHGPVLLVPSSLPLPSSVTTELTRLKPQKIVVLGGASVVSEAIRTALQTYQVGPGSVGRYAGLDRYATAAAISANTFAAGVPIAMVATGTNFPDALSGAAAAGYKGGPVLLVPSSLPLPSALVAELTRLKPTKIVVLGGTSVVSESIRTALQPYQVGPGSVGRYAGSDRYSTSAAISANTFTLPPVNYAFIATGLNFPDALAGSAAAGYLGGPVLLVPSSLPLPSAISSELTRLKPKHIVVLGGPSVVSDSIKNALNAYIVP